MCAIDGRGGGGGHRHRCAIVYLANSTLGCTTLYTLVTIYYTAKILSQVHVCKRCAFSKRSMYFLFNNTTAQRCKNTAARIEPGDDQQRCWRCCQTISILKTLLSVEFDFDIEDGWTKYIPTTMNDIATKRYCHMQCTKQFWFALIYNLSQTLDHSFAPFISL